jgi:hypothetical protein
MIVVLAAGFLSGCRIEPFTPTALPAPTQTPSLEQPLTSLLPTLENNITETPTPAATATQMVKLPAAAGERLFYDPLDNDAAGWTLQKTASGSAAFTNGLLVFTIGTPYSELGAVLRKDFPSDIYIQVMVQTLICGAGVDTFGIIFRTQGDHSYRYAITCRGKLRLERYSGGVLDGANAWQDTLGLLQGAPATNQIGVLLQGTLFRFFVNGAEVFANHDPVNRSGGVGLFAETEKSQMLSVAFDDLAVYAVRTG